MAHEDEVRREIAKLGLTADELQEFVDLDLDFAWQRPLTRAAVIAYLEAAAQPEPYPSDALDQPASEHVDPQPEQQPIASESRLTEPEPLQLQQAERADSSQRVVAVESLSEQLEPQQLQQQQLATAQHFSIGTVAEDSNFDIAAGDSDEADSIASPVEADPDVAFWWGEFLAVDAQGLQQTGEQQPLAPSDEGGRPAKRHRPG